MGLLNKNSDFGIYGKLNNSAQNFLLNRLYKIALKNEIKEGTATILANIDGNTVNEYKVLIERVSINSFNNLKGMIIRITDEELINMTGGIIQGMSGSPIIQNNKLIGAITHVLVNDPTRGYGIFIENMLQNQ